MKTISIDIETFSSVDLTKAGVYKYAESPDFAILLFGYSVDGGKVNVIDLALGESIPLDIVDALTDDRIQKWAFNANFERVCLSRYLSDMGLSLDPFADNHFSAEYLGLARFLNPESWRCSMVWAAYMGLPLSLENVGTVLKLKQQKMTEGKKLISLFSKPNRSGKRVYPSDRPDEWRTFKEYNARDVEVEMAIQTKLAKFPVPDAVWEEYRLDQEINDRGVALDMTLVRNAISADEKSRQKLSAAMRGITNLENPNSVAQMKTWLAENGMAMDSLGKKEVAAAIENAPDRVAKALTMRQALAKSSVRKYQAMETCVCVDSRVRGLFQFYGANRTGRAAGRLIQAQNLPQNHLPDLDAARSLVRSGDFKTLELLYDSVPEVLSELIRTAFVPKADCKLIVSDFSSIEAVILAWLAGEQWVLDAYRAKHDLYIRNAERMFGAAPGSVDKKSPLRQKSKIAVLACGYQGAAGALKAFGALDMGIKEEDLQGLVNAWRQANPSIVKFWWEADEAARSAVRDKTESETHGIKFSYESGMLFITLPSGRRLCYVKPKLAVNRFGSECVTYEGLNAAKKWGRLESSPGKWVENITQAVARDILYNAMNTLRCCSIVLHVHDEVVLEADKRMSMEAVCEQMSRLPSWASGLPLRADGYECDFYQKQ
jgi:DNA polymerase